MFVHTCLFFFSTFHFRSRLSILLFFHSLFSSYSYTYAYTLVSCTHNGIHTRTRTHTTHKNTYTTYVYFPYHACKRAHTHNMYTYSFLLFLSLDRSVNVPYRVYDSWSSPCRAMEADRWHSSLLTCTVTMIIP